MAINIAELLEKGKYYALYDDRLRDAYLLLMLLAVALGAFACGRLSNIAEKDSPVAIEKIFPQDSSTSETSPTPQGQGRAAPSKAGSVVASKNGSKYHLPWCSGGKTIKEENKIWFASESDAIAAGFVKAANCK